MDLQLKDKVVLITGGGKGIGEAITRGCAREGAIPVFVDKDAVAGKKLESELQNVGAVCRFLCADILPVESSRAVVEQTLQEFGRLDILVNNVGANDNVGLENGSPENYVSSLRLNLFHYYNTAHFALPALKKSQGCILNIASKVAVTGQGGTSGYTSAKGAILSLTRDWAAELLPCGIRVNALVPAEVITPLYKQWVSTFPNPEEKLAHIVSKIPLGKRMTQPHEIAAMVLFLISPQASHITGQHVFVVTLPEIGGIQPDGLLGADILLAFDLDIDLPAHRLTIYRARPCADSRPPWTMPYASVEGVGMWRDRLMVPVSVNGADGRAVLDTGAQRTVIRPEFAARGNVTQAMLDTDPGNMLRGASRESMSSRLHRFDTIRIGTETIHDARLPVASLPGAEMDALIGGDFLRGRRIWLSAASHQMFFTPPEP